MQCSVAAADRTNPEQVCEGYYYAAEHCLMQGRIDKAREWFQKCVETDLVLDLDAEIDPMNKYHLARRRLEQMSTEGIAPRP